MIWPAMYGIMPLVGVSRVKNIENLHLDSFEEIMFIRTDSIYPELIRMEDEFKKKTKIDILDNLFPVFLLYNYYY